MTAFQRIDPALPRQQQRRRSRKPKVCPDCGQKFQQAPRKYVDWAMQWANHCPHCNAAIHYRKKNGKIVDVVLLEDKVAVDDMIALLKRHLSDRTEFEFDPTQATGRERKFAYDLIGWAVEFMNSAGYDLGMTVHQFLLEWLRFILEDEENWWWGVNLRSILQLQNQKDVLAQDFYEKLARQRGVETPRSAKTKTKLKELIAEF